MFSRQHRKARILYGLSDAALVALAFEAAYRTRMALPLENIFYIMVPVKALALGASVLLWTGAGSWLGVYDRLDSGDPRIILRDAFRQSAYAATGLVLFEYSLRLDLSRAFLALLALYCWLFLSIYRLLAGRLAGVISRQFGSPRFVMLVGAGERARRLGEALERSAQYGIRLKGFLADEPGARGQLELSERYPVFDLSELPALLGRNVIDEIIFAVESERLSRLEEVFLLCDEEGVRTRVAVDFFPHVNSEIYLERLGFTPLLTFSAAPHDEVRLLLKRLLDVLAAVAGLLLLSPFMLVAVALVRLTSAGPAIFRQERCGLNGRRFTFYKFRSMCKDAEARKAQLLHLNRRRPAFKLAGDPRLTPLGRFLRRYSVDEWPQLWNVLKGDMSLVGPRPAIPEEVEQYARWQRRRMRMRPGITCLWALAGRDELDFESWMKLDMEYIDNWSLGLDCKILLKTIPRVLSGKGAS